MPVRSSASHEGVELSIRQSPGLATQTLLHSASDEPSARHARRRTTMADMRSRLLSLKSKHPEGYYRAKVALAFFTLARIAANLYVTAFAAFGDIFSKVRDSSGEQVRWICDGTWRLVVSGLEIYVFLHRIDRFSSKNPLHPWSLVTVVCLAVPLFD